MSKVKIITDSASDISTIDEIEYDITILPFAVSVGDKGYMEREDFTPLEFYDILIEAPKIPTTAQLTAHRLGEEFEKVLATDEYTEIVYVSINSKGSGSYQNAVMARDEFYENHPDLKGIFNIFVIDSLSYTSAYGYPVVEAAKKAQKGASGSELSAFLTDWFDSVEIYFAPYTLEFVKKSGRVPVAAAFVGELIGLRPIISIIDGETKIVEKVRGDKAIIPALLKHAKNAMVPKTPYTLVKGMLDNEANDLLIRSKKEFGYPAADIYQIGAAISINAGPKVVGIIVKGQNRNHKKNF